ncbi:sigma-54-dependent Fis family transcriptional regulator [Pseudomonas sp. FW306-02-F02-AA]|uniref:Fis family transcriptional regulator n=1 Tax=Pseudomonas fluorescens TaxID=294 RepID=A0A0N9VN04_PSEFL|nr:MULTISPECIES: sigma-54-dependent Fis family transcriptional regulator [Pseudomonas]ALI01275.1 Fis family transcriptional regulator [Pseudomonas fluorescens]PMZ01901.1 sigma-54-dependent Fis family transcriptional regulator [Pseudomonas sp. FW306-02-F02-AB]PMZ07703.1 sigma-54-dependent Fis family transcriptional regulator [Pseudomonas sp. FW306-02-H06C]PMZ13550.1 sigma-54-dependent Fis family transcriptional regulator [Pseudomonas sp. FW306-02-F02-AA]PMZ19651.1 sigma-54-dependent Fis family 
MFTRVPQPLVYAEALLAKFASLSCAADGAALLGDFVRAVAELSRCELSQLYLLDVTHTSLGLNAECLQGILQPRETASLPADYNGEQLLQFSLCQNRVLSLTGLSGSLHETSFLPEQAVPWQSLLCVPLLNPQKAVVGLLLCASREQVELQGFSDSLGQLGSFVLGQLHLLQRLRRPVGDVSPMPSSVPSASGYGLIGKSSAMRQTYQLISKVLHSPYTVLLRGETGTGKEVVARAIHDCGPRRSRAFIVQNCAAFPENLLESELFGYRKGAFTGADRDRAGLFDAANGGTLLLDEIGDMPLSLQAKLLRVLQEGEIRPLGSNDTHKIDVRIIAATHRDLAVLVSEGKFREDLYYRLAQFPIELPALRQREGDILDLARHFADKACTFLQRDAVRWSDAALDHLSSYAFPGNVRELKGLVERAVLLCEGGELLAEHFSLRIEVAPQESSLNLRERLEQVERSLLLDCLRKNDGNQTLAARALGLPRRTLLYRLGRLNINMGDFDG